MWWILLNDFFWRERYSTAKAIIIAVISGLLISAALVAIAYFLL